MLFYSGFLIFACISVCISVCFSQTPVTVTTNVGSIMGFQEYVSVDGEQKLISKFLGIPYAESTAGQNRFRKPVPKAPFHSTFDARKIPLACYQQSKQGMDLHRNTYGVPGFSEDCLTLNIYVPHGIQSRDMLPVMIWVYGGGFNQGASSIYNPEILALFGNVIVVTINYRIGMFGFLRDKRGIFTGNHGLWDQHLAIKWVHDNIDMFTGYKDEITIFGQSAGAASVLFQALYPGNDGLFKRVIAESGTPLAAWAMPDISSIEVYLREQGCLHDSGTPTFITCLQSKSPDELLSNITNFGPVVDGEFLVDTPSEIMNGNAAKTASARDFFASLDIILGANDIDASGYLPYFAYTFGYSSQIFNVTKKQFREQIVPLTVNITFNTKDNATKLALEKVLTNLYTNWKDPEDYINIRGGVLDMVNDAIFYAPAIQVANAHSTLQRGKTYFYQFAIQSRNHVIPVPPWLNGSNHGDEIPYVLGLILKRNNSFIGNPPYNSTAEEKQISRAVMTSWSNFAKSGNPNVPMNVTQITNTLWPDYTMTSHRYIKISNQMSVASVHEDFYPMRMAIWSNVISLIVEQQNCPKAQPDITHFDPSSGLVG